MESDRAHALEFVQGAKLAHPDLPLVECFLRDAKDGNQAARHILEIRVDDPSGIKFKQFLEDWKALVKMFFVENPRPDYLDHMTRRAIAQRDNHRCCMTGTRGQFWNRNHVFPIIPLNALRLKEQRLYDILGAFITPSQREYLLSAKDGTTRNLISNHWTLSKDGSRAFSRGEIRLESLGLNKYDIRYNYVGCKTLAIYTPERIFRWRCDLSDRSNSGIDSPDPVLLEVHGRFSAACKWTDVAASMQQRSRQGSCRKASRAHLREAIVTSFLAVWLKFPSIVRLQTYKLLNAAGLYLYGPTDMGVQRLPFGMYLKSGTAFQSRRNTAEFSALTLVRSRTSIPVPRPIDLIQTPTGSFMVTSRIEGDIAGLTLDYLSDEEMTLMAQDLRQWINELHDIKPPSGSSFSISNASGGACLDYRIGIDPVGPFQNEKEFSESLRLGILPNLVHRDDHEIVFTHADLNMRNIMVKNGRISGIIDWENAGWYPEYWEMTKCHFGTRLKKRWLKMVDAVFENKYAEELEIERQYWDYTTLI